MLLLVDEGHGIIASQYELARLLKSDERLLMPAVQELVAEGLLYVEGRQPLVYLLLTSEPYTLYRRAGVRAVAGSWAGGGSGVLRRWV